MWCLYFFYNIKFTSLIRSWYWQWPFTRVVKILNYLTVCLIMSFKIVSRQIRDKVIVFCNSFKFSINNKHTTLHYKKRKNISFDIDYFTVISRLFDLKKKLCPWKPKNATSYEILIVQCLRWYSLLQLPFENITFIVPWAPLGLGKYIWLFTLFNWFIGQFRENWQLWWLFSIVIIVMACG